MVANEVKEISGRVSGITLQLRDLFTRQVRELQSTAREVAGVRLADLARYTVELIDRNLYERSCDVRWWATDSAVVDACGTPSAASAAFASERLGIILDSYTVYLDLWIADASGTVIASGRPGRYPDAVGASVADTEWFRGAMRTADGSCFVVTDIERAPHLGGKAVATYATAIREGGDVTGRPIGALGIFFDWEPQAHSIVTGLGFSTEEQARTRVMLVDRNRRVIASSDGQGILTETYPLDTRGGRTRGSYAPSQGRLVGFALTPGYETYDGLGWYGVIEQADA